MKNKNIYLPLWVGSALVFALFTLLVAFVDVQEVGPNGSLVGLAGLNGAFYNLTGTNFVLYDVTDWGGILAILLGVFFAGVGVYQWAKRKSLAKVDKNLFALAVLFAATLAVYLFFELVVINCRPVLINGVLEVSYPSSTTVLAMVFLLSAIDQIDVYVKNQKTKTLCKAICLAYCAFLVVGRLVCGVHWLTDVLGGVIISLALICFYKWLLCVFCK